MTPRNTISYPLLNIIACWDDLILCCPLQLTICLKVILKTPINSGKYQKDIDNRAKLKYLAMNQYATLYATLQNLERWTTMQDTYICNYVVIIKKEGVKKCNKHKYPQERKDKVLRKNCETQKVGITLSGYLVTRNVNLKLVQKLPNTFWWRFNVIVQKITN